ncbi:MAG: redoxin family protein, partial [Candidatus Omnitrophica bacterium]|nr:redoxin family protein [Candidatus Omnitrophota bacterium]
MHSRWTHALILTIIAMLSALPSEASDRILPDFQWADIDGNTYQLSEVLGNSDTKIVVFAFSGIGCPLVNVYAPKLEKFSKEYA